jgi:hypothetical protein
MFVIYIHTKFCTLNLNGLFVISKNPKVKEKFRPATILLFYIVQKTKAGYFSKI